jgi:hypothetical protein
MLNPHRAATLCGLIIVSLFLARDSAAQQQTGTLTGTITTPEGKPVNAGTGLLATGVFVNLQEHGLARGYDPGDFRKRGVFNDLDNGRSRVSSELKLSGLYAFRDLRPGVYDLVVEAGQLPESPGTGYTHYRPQRIVGIVVKPGQQTVFDIVMHPSGRVEGVGDPTNNTLEMVGEPKGNAQEGLKWGWIEGAVTNPEGQPVWSSVTLLVTGVALTLKKSTGEQVTLQTDHLAGGFYSASNLKSGMYDMILEKGTRYKNVYRPQIISRVMIKPGIRTILNITVHPGDALERVSAPQIVTQPVTLAAK